MKFAGVAALLVFALSSPVAQAQADRGGQLKCMHDVVESATVTARFFWTENGVKLTVEGQTFTCTPTNPIDQQTVTQPPTANGWLIELVLASNACVAPTFCSNTDSGTFEAGGTPRVRSRFDFVSEGTAVFSLSRNP